MPTVKLIAQGPPEATQDAMDWFLNSLVRNGQLVSESSDYHVYQDGDAIVAIVRLPFTGAMDPDRDSQWVADARSKLEAVATVRIEPVGGGSPGPVAAPEVGPTLLLFSGDGTIGPVCSIAGETVPMCLLGLDPTTTEALYQWRRMVKAAHAIWIAAPSPAAEALGLHELSCVDSGLTTRGRCLASAVEQQTDIPVFYYLDPSGPPLADQADHRCPGCGGPWRWTSSPRFDFRCDPCRLISVVGPGAPAG